MKTTFTTLVKTCFFTILCLLGTTAFAQLGPDSVYVKPDTAHFNFGDHGFEIIIHPQTFADKDTAADDPDEDDLTHWAGIDIGVNGWFTPDRSLAMSSEHKAWELDYARSISFNFNFMEKKIPIRKEFVGLFTGLGLEYNAYAFKNDVNLWVDPDTVMATLDTVIDFSKSKLKATYLNLPLMLEFNTSRKKEKSFHFATGVLVGWRINSKWKYKYDTPDEQISNKIKSHYHLNSFKIAASARVGYRKFSLFANYSLNPVFEKDKGPELYAFNVGVTLAHF